METCGSTPIVEQASLIRLKNRQAVFQTPQCLKAVFREHILKPGLSLSFLNLEAACQMTWKFKAIDMPLGFSYNLSGTSRILTNLGHGKRAEIQRQQVSSSMCYLLDATGTWEYGPGFLQEMTISLDSSYLRMLMEQGFALDQKEIASYANECQKENIYKILPVTCGMMPVIRQIANCDLKGKLRTLFWECKVIELLILQIAHITEKTLPETIPLSSYDVERLYEAKDILWTDMNNPPSLHQLAKRVGINEFKLKKGFKQVFGTSVFGLLRTMRLEKAKKFLEQGEMNVRQASFAVGFANQSNFSSLFQKAYGLKPRDLVRTARRQKHFIPQKNSESAFLN